MKVLVTGSASRLAQAVLPVLAADDRIEQIVGIDRHETAFTHDRFTQILLDVRSIQVAHVVAGMDAVVHLAFVTSARDRNEMRDINVNGGQNVVRSCAERSVRCLIHVSSATVYELPARERPISEQHPRTALRGCAEAEDAVAFEAWLDGYEAQRVSLRIVRLRPHLIVGPHARRLVRLLLRSPFALRLAIPTPRLQCVHETDVANAVLQALHKDVGGAFNLACADNATLREMQRLRGGGLMPVPFPLARAALALARAFGLNVDPSRLESLRHELVLDTSRALRRLGWRPRYDSVQACLEATD